MFENTLDLAENKLLLLYIFKKIKVPLSNNKITQIILENNFINYFILQQYIHELINSQFIKYANPDTDHKMVITKKGVKVLNLFENMISKDKIQKIDDYFKSQIENIKEDISVSSSYTEENKNSFIVDLIAAKDKSTLMNIKVNIGSKKEAIELCEKWKNNSQSIYYEILHLLLQK
ncbi:putative transcriptional regulator [Clostridium algifaecis]|uniref:Transcriptional regulator n=1 Tax=Clostridium algifaecis TaxID=1472040 RepID=A0ABS4KWT2_9CLOT|nr:DUF4364 family protein [Clostridium algifaecis]MBP2033369.1 putative transcriptional regulator [Clostridium algifaecis]